MADYNTTDGTLTLANSYSSSSWGAPTTTVASGFSGLKFRFLYVGAADVQWDDAGLGLGLYYMHARHYSPGARQVRPARPQCRRGQSVCICQQLASLDR